MKQHINEIRRMQQLAGINDIKIIKEFLYTINSEKTIDQLIKQIGDGIEIKEEFLNDNKKIIITFKKLSIEYLDKVNTFMDKFGWYPSFIDPDSPYGDSYSRSIKYRIGENNIDITYEAKYDEEVYITEDYLYHLTTDIRWPKIKAIGLTPKTQGKLANHPGRIYLLTKYSEEELKELVDNLRWLDPNRDKIKEMYLLKIDTSQIKNHKFFEDPNFGKESGVWTYQNIPPSAITIIRKISTI